MEQRKRERKPDTMMSQGERGQWTVYYTSPQSFKIAFSYSLAEQLWGLLINYGWLVHKVEYLKRFTTNCNLQKG